MATVKKPSGFAQFTQHATEVERQDLSKSNVNESSLKKADFKTLTFRLTKPRWKVVKNFCTEHDISLQDLMEEAMVEAMRRKGVKL